MSEHTPRKPRIEYGPKGWGSSYVLYDHNGEEILNDRIAPDYDTLKFFEGLLASAPLLSERVKELEALVTKVAALDIRADRSEQLHKINVLVRDANKLIQ